MTLLLDVLFCAALALIVAGVALIYVPAALMVAGALTLALVVVLVARGPATESEGSQ